MSVWRQMSALVDALVKAQTEDSQLEKATRQVGAVVRTPTGIHGVDIANEHNVGRSQTQRAER